MNKLLQYLMNKPNVDHRILPGLQKAKQPCYECGGSVKKYAIGGYYDCPDQEKDPVTGKCSAEVARGKEVAAANKAATADMNAWAKQVAAMDKENARQNAAQTAGQLTFDYDWMQSPVEKADKKAAISQYKQFFQQNPNVFVPDDTSGYSPEQKYIIASKLKQRLSTPMGSQLAQKKLGVDPRYYDLQRMQSELAPKMGGWNGMRDFLFNVYKEQGGEYDLPQAQWGQFISPVDMGMMASKVMNFFGFNKQPNIVRTPASAPKRLSIRDPRKIMMTTGKPLRPNSDLVSGEYDSEDLGNLLTEAKRRNMSYDDMMNLAAMGFQETKWGKSDSNIGHTQGNFGPEEDSYSSFINAYNNKMKEADRLNIKDEATRLQVYNGFGKIFPSTEADYHGFKMKKIYGVPVPKGGIDLRKNPLYGKQVVDIRDNVLKRNPEFMSYMDSTYKAPIPKEDFANGGPILDPRGQWAHPGKVTRIPSSNITMQGVPYPVLGIGSNGQQQMMQPGRNYNFGGASYVDEYPMMQKGGQKEKSVINRYTDVNSRAADIFRSLVPLPDNASQMIAKVLFKDARMSNNSLSDDQKLILWNTIQNAKKRSGVPSGGGTEYQDYGNQGYGSSDDFNNWFNKGKMGPLDVARYSLTNPGYKLASTIGRGRYWQDPKNPDEVFYTDVYDWNPSEANFSGSNAYQLLRNYLRSGEDKNLNKDKNDNYRMNFKLSKKEIDEIKKRKEEEAQSILGLGLFKNGGGLLSKSVTCSNCGWSWKSTDGGIDPLTCHKCGGMVKMQRGGTAYIDSVLNANQNLDWVKRLYQKNGPSLQIPGLKGPSTHYMESADGRVYPKVAMLNNKLTYLPAAGIDPFDYADSTKTYIKFPTDKEATWFGKNYKQGTGVLPKNANGGQHGGLDRWFAEKWVDVKTGKTCGRQEGENRAYPACRPSKRISSQTPKTSSEMSPAEKAKFKRTKTSSERIPYNHKK